MTPRPVALGLYLCGQALVDEKSRNPTLIDVFTGLAVNGFPSEPKQFTVFATVTGTAGRGTIELRAIRVASGEQIYSQQGVVNLFDRTDMVNLFFQVSMIRFPQPGFYLFQLLVDGELIREAQRRIRVYQRKQS